MGHLSTRVYDVTIQPAIILFFNFIIIEDIPLFFNLQGKQIIDSCHQIQQQQQQQQYISYYFIYYGGYMFCSFLTSFRPACRT